MKKLFLISALTLLVAGSMPVFATEINEETTEPAKTIVTYGVGDSYTVTIPANFELDGTKVSKDSVKASEVYIPSGKKLQVTISSENYDTTWNLVDTKDETNQVPYSITAGGADVVSGGVILEVKAGTTTGGTQELSFQVTEASTIAGTYEDTLNFVVSVVPENN